MNNLKRVLSLLLAVIMIVGCMAISASAATFSDADKIADAKEEAVNSLVVLKVISGKDDGTFDPTGIVTREQAAKMIYVALNGGKDNSSLTKRNPAMFTDSTNWAQGYVEWCAVKGIIAGRGDGTFDPQGELTPTALAKLLLVAIGYDAKIEGLEGTVDWAINTNSLALAKDFYDGLEDIDPSEPMTREDAAQMIWNAVHAEMVDYDDKLTVSDGQLTARNKVYGLGKTILNDAYGMPEVTDTADVITYVSILTKAEPNDDGTYNYTLVTAGVTQTDTLKNHTTNLTDCADDYTALIGHTVTVLRGNSATKIYGLVDASVVLAEGQGAVETSDADGIKLAGKTYAYAEDDSGDPVAAITYDYNTATTDNGFSDIDKVVLLDTDDDGLVDRVLVTPVAVEQVTFVGTTSITTENLLGTGATPYAVSKTTSYDGIAKGDIVTVVLGTYTVDKKTVLTKLETTEGKVAAVKSGTIRLDGETAFTSFADNANDSDATLNTTINYAKLGDLIVYAKAVDAAGTSVDDVLYVAVLQDSASSAVNYDSLTGNTGANARVILADGTNAVVKVGIDANGDGNYDTGSNAQDALDAGSLFTYTTDSAGNYLLKAVADANPTGTKFDDSIDNKDESAAFAYVKSTSLVDAKYAIADDAKVIIVTTTEKTDSDGNDGKFAGAYSSAKVITGKELKALNSLGKEAKVIYKAVSGLDTIQLAVITTAASSSSVTSGTSYGYVVTTGYATKVSGKIDVTFDVWTGSETVTLTAKDVASANQTAIASEFTAGAFISYETTTTEGEITNVQEVGTASAVTGWDGSKYIAFDGADAVAVTSSTVIIYVDTANVAGVEGGSIALATEVSAGVLNKNVVHDGVNVIFVDVSNKIASADSTALTGDLKNVSFRNLANGLYTPVEGTEDSETLLDTTRRPDELLIFKFTTKEDTDQTYTLKIDLASASTNGGAVYEETTASLTKNSAYLIIVDRTGYKYVTGATGSLGTSTDGTGALTAGTEYQYVITGADGETYLEGTFVAQPQPATPTGAD